MSGVVAAFGAGSWAKGSSSAGAGGIAGFVIIAANFSHFWLHFTFGAIAIQFTTSAAYHAWSFRRYGARGAGLEPASRWLYLPMIAFRFGLALALWYIAVRIPG